MAPDVNEATTTITATISAVLLGLTWAAARADDVAGAAGEVAQTLPPGLDGVTFPAAIAFLAWSLRGWTPTVRHVVEVDDATRRSLERAARLRAGTMRPGDVTDHGEGP